MYFRKDISFANIATQLSALIGLIEINCKIDKYDISREAENFFRDIFNIVYDANFINLNDERRNHPAVDLGCDKTSTAVQVTSTPTNKKIKDAIGKFIKYKLDQRFKKLRIFLLTHPRENIKLEKQSGFSVDVFSISDLVVEIYKLNDPARGAKLQEFVNRELPGITAALALPESILKRSQSVVPLPAVSAAKILGPLYGDFDEKDIVLALKKIDALYYFLWKQCDRRVREYLYAMVQQSDFSGSWDETLKIDYRTVMDVYNIKREDAEYFYSHLSKFGILDQVEEGSFEVVVNYYLKSLDANFLALLKRFCLGDDSLLKSIIVDLNFELLG